MEIAIITGSGGLIGSEAIEFFSKKFDVVVGIDNNMRKEFFGDSASTAWNIERLQKEVPNYFHCAIDIRDQNNVETVFSEFGKDIRLIVHCAAQPSHDWAAKDPVKDFTVNANGTLVLLENARVYCPDSVFVFCSTNKVYGDTPNHLPLVELETRWEVDSQHHYYENGIDENMPIDHTKHSLFGASKVAADVLVQEYGRYFGMKTACFRGGCLTGPKHSGTQLHGFLSYLVQCAVTEKEYTIFGYKGKQVRDNIHSWDLVNMFWHYYLNPRSGQVYNAGGSRYSSCSMLEAISISESITGKKMRIVYDDRNRIGDHIWWISDVTKFRNHYPDWDYKYGLEDIIGQIFEEIAARRNQVICKVSERKPVHSISKSSKRNLELL